MVTTKAIRIRTRIVKDTFVEDGAINWERTTKSILVTAMDEEADLMALHNKVVRAIKEA